jgi:hypothetical protein
MRPAALRMLALACSGSLLIGGCASMGPATVVRDRFDYVAAMSESWKRQMLLNLVKVRYADAPVFLDVASLINSYSWEAELAATGQVTPSGRAGDTFLSLAGTGRYADRPTITYAPLTGERLARSLLSPLPVSAILYLFQGGYPADAVLRACVISVNGLENAYGGTGNPRAGSAQFHELLTLMRQAQMAGAVGIRVKKSSDKEPLVFFFRASADQAALSLQRRIREILALDQRAREVEVVYGDFPSDAREIAILTRSMLQVLTDAASFIDVPEADAVEGRVYVPVRSPEQLQMFSPLLRVHSGKSAPADSHVAIRYRDYWFWVDDRDAASKTALNFLMLMFSLTETAGPSPAPVVTVPAR